MLHAWNRILPQYSHLIQKNKKTALSEAFAKVLQEIGPSIKITSLTNALAFSITIFFSTPAMESFCIAAFVAIILDFIFEITLFGSSLVISGKFYKVPKYSPEKKSCRSWSLQYSRFLTKKSTRIGVILLSFGFLLISLYGTLTIETKIDSQRIIPYDSPLRESDKLFKEYYWKEHELIEIFVTSPPNISNPEEFSEFQRMMNEFHDLPRAIGSTSTVLFLDDYIKVDKAYLTILYLFGGEFPYSYDELPDFLGTRAGLLYNHTVRWHENEQGQTVVDAFKFYTGFHNATTWMERAENMLNWRRVASRWSQFNVTVYSENAAVFEGIFNMASQTSLSATSTLICMIVVCFLFVPSLVGVVMAAFAIASISLGVVGFLSLTGLALDPVTMSAIVMSIGFSVDYTAHISYHFQSAWNVQLTSASSTDCLHHTISAVASPMLQAAASTIACFIPVAFHPDCTPTVFIRTIFLVVTFGVLHGLLILPTLLAMLPRRYFVFDTSSSPSIYRQARSSLLVEKKSVEPSEPFHSGVVTLLPEIESSKSSQETMESLISPTESES